MFQIITCIVKVHRAQWATRSIAWLWSWIFLRFSFFTFSPAYGTPAFYSFSIVSSVHFCSVAQSCSTLCNPMECSMLGFPVHHSFQGLLKLMYIESVMPSNHFIFCHPLLLLPSIFPSIRVFSWASSSHQVAKGLEFQLQQQFFQWIFRTDFL